MDILWMILLTTAVLQTTGPSTLPSQDAAVWSAAVLYYSESNSDQGVAPGVIVVPETVPGQRMTLVAPGRATKIQSYLLRRLKEQNTATRPVAGLSLPQGVTTPSRAENLIRRKTPHRIEVNWPLFRRTYPNSFLMQLSVPAYGEGGNQALVYVSVGRDAMAAKGWLYLLQKQNGVWRVVVDEILWIA